MQKNKKRKNQKYGVFFGKKKGFFNALLQLFAVTDQF